MTVLYNPFLRAKIKTRVVKEKTLIIKALTAKFKPQLETAYVAQYLTAQTNCFCEIFCAREKAFSPFSALSAVKKPTHYLSVAESLKDFYLVVFFFFVLTEM